MVRGAHNIVLREAIEFNWEFVELYHDTKCLEDKQIKIGCQTEAGNDIG